MKSTNHTLCSKGDGSGDAGGDGEAHTDAYFNSASCIDSELVPEVRCNRESTVEKVSAQQNQTCVFQGAGFPTMEGHNSYDLKMSFGIFFWQYLA